MLKAIIFDMDGVLLDSEAAWPELEFERYSSLIHGWTREDHKKLTGLSLNDSYRMFVHEYGLNMTWKEYSGFYERSAEEVYCHRANLIPGVFELLKELKKRQIPMGLATSSPNYWLDMVFKRFPFLDYLDCVVGADEVGGRGKPSPDIYIEAVKRMNLSPSACISIEDSLNGVLSAVRAGLYSIGFRNGHNDHADLSRANEEIHGFGADTIKRILDLLGGAL